MRKNAFSAIKHKDFLHRIENDKSHLRLNESKENSYVNNEDNDLKNMI